MARSLDKLNQNKHTTKSKGRTMDDEQESDRALVVWRSSIYYLLLATVMACQPASIGSQFFKESFATKEGYDGAVNRLENYPLDEQWQIFLYANQVVHPPFTDMAIPIAKRGKPALDYILEQLEQPNHEFDF
jgi:hypothetical protein